MDSKLLAILEAYDKPEYRPYPPPGFDHEQTLKRVKRIESMLEEIIGRSFRFFDNVGQPLNYFADLITQLPQFGERGLHIKFSYFGDLFTIEVGAIHSPRASEELRLSEYVTDIAQIIQSHGFVYIDAKSLLEVYTNETERDDDICTWRDVYFSTLPL